MSNDKNATTTTITITRREYFAAMAIQGLVSNPDIKPTVDGSRFNLVNESFAKMSVMVADALISELDKKL